MPDKLRTAALAALTAETLRAGAAVRFRAVGTSMIPAIWPGDVLAIKPLNGWLPEVGAIALTFTQGRLRAHRVVERSAGGAAGWLTTRGDALSSSDPTAQAVEILGVVIARNDRPLAASHGMRALINRASCRSPLRWLRLKYSALRLRAFVPGPNWRSSAACGEVE
jgi:hypothetical protein